VFDSIGLPAQLTVLAGTNYSLNANTITPSAGFVGELTVPVTVSDGWLSSEVFNASVTVNAAIDPDQGGQITWMTNFQLL
ncbi:MAG: hypothetical protein COW84_03620, partial [Gammaproteobacteria bacterium CG22_combo_CG10-13_8_21_14_all_40_8]